VPEVRRDWDQAVTAPNVLLFQTREKRHREVAVCRVLIELRRAVLDEDYYTRLKSRRGTNCPWYELMGACARYDILSPLMATSRLADRTVGIIIVTLASLPDVLKLPEG
jgi:hypothetical protein